MMLIKTYLFVPCQLFFHGGLSGVFFPVFLTGHKLEWYIYSTVLHVHTRLIYLVKVTSESLFKRFTV